MEIRRPVDAAVAGFAQRCFDDERASFASESVSKPGSPIGYMDAPLTGFSPSSFMRKGDFAQRIRLAALPIRHAADRPR